MAANRKIHISVSLPAGTDTRTDKLRITINGKQVDEKKVTLEIGNTFTYTTEKKYRGDVKVQVELDNTKKSAKVTVKKGTDTANSILKILRICWATTTKRQLVKKTK